VGDLISIADTKKRINKTKENEPVDMRHVRVLLQTGEDEFSDILSQIIKHSYDVQTFILSSPKEEDLLVAAKNDSFDIFIITLNNIHYYSYRPRDEDLYEGAFHLVSYLRTTYEKPVLALYGYPDDQDSSDKVKLAGASFVLNLPFKAEPLIEAFKGCLEQL